MDFKLGIEIEARRIMAKGKLGVLFLLAIGSFLYSATAQVAVNSKGETIVSSQLGTAAIHAKITTRELANGTADKPVKPHGSACTMSRFPCSVVDEIEIAAAGEQLFVPRSAFADLSDVNNAKLTTEHGKFVLLLVGGDASESYIARIVFNRKRVTYRSLTSGEFPEHPLQETIYHLSD
jgi:hypothetical protein